MNKNKTGFFPLVFLFFLFYLPPAAPAEQDKLNLTELLQLAKERNPGLLSLQEEIKAYQFRVEPQATLPDPVLAFSLRNIAATQFTVGQEMMSGVGFSVSQMIPFPGKLRLKKEMAKIQVQRAKRISDGYTLALFRQLKELYAKLFYFQKSLRVLEKKKLFLEKALEAASIRYSVGEGVQTDVLKARLEIAELDQMIKPMEQMLRAVEGQINSLLAFPMEKRWGEAEEIPVFELNIPLGQLIAAAIEKSPKLKEAELMIEEQELEVRLSRREFLPNFMIQVGKEFKGPFKDMYEVMIGVEIPLFIKKKQANLLEASLAELSQARYSFASMENELLAMVNENYLLAKSAENLIKITRNSLLPQASLTLESSLANYQVGKVDFLTFLADIDALFSYEMDYYRQLSELWQAVSRIEELTGLNLLSEVKNEN